jgi:hypothetical protein
MTIPFLMDDETGLKDRIAELELELANGVPGNGSLKTGASGLALRLAGGFQAEIEITGITMNRAQ